MARSSNLIVTTGMILSRIIENLDTGEIEGGRVIISAIQGIPASGWIDFRGQAAVSSGDELGITPKIIDYLTTVQVDNVKTCRFSL
jgi:hypothetical protein